MIRMHFPEQFTRIEEGVLISIESVFDCRIKLSNGLIIKARFIGKQNMHFEKIAKIDKRYFIAIYDDAELMQGRILTKYDFKYHSDIQQALKKIPNHLDLLDLK